MTLMEEEVLKSVDGFGIDRLRDYYKRSVFESVEIGYLDEAKEVIEKMKVLNSVDYSWDADSISSLTYMIRKPEVTPYIMLEVYWVKWMSTSAGRKIFLQNIVDKNRGVCWFNTVAESVKYMTSGAVISSLEEWGDSPCLKSGEILLA